MGNDIKDVNEIKVVDCFNLEDNNFLITGGSRGIRFASAKTMANLGGVAVIGTLPEPTEEFHSFATRFGVKTYL